MMNNPTITSKQTSFRRSALVATALMGTMAAGCGDMHGDAYLGETGPALEQQEQSASGLPSAVGNIAPSCLHTWRGQTMANAGGNSLVMYSFANTATDAGCPTFERATSRLVVFSQRDQNIVSVVDGVSEWSWNTNCSAGACTVDVTATDAASFAVQSETFRLAANGTATMINVTSLEGGTAYRTESEQDTDACQFNDSVLDYAANSMGQVVGNGECWTLANEALIDAGAHAAQGYHLGSTIGTNSLFGAEAGDILQLENIRSSQGWMLGMPQHTAIIESVSGSTVTVYEQNNPVGSAVTLSTYDFSTITSGSYVVFRAAPTWDDRDESCGASAPVRECPAGQILDCNGSCAPESWLGDSYCDDGTYSFQGARIDLSCSLFNADNGDC